MARDLDVGAIVAALRLKNEFTPELQKAVASAQRAGQQMQAAGRVLTLGITAPLVGVAAASVKASIDFESSFTGVRKTVNATEPELQALADGFRDLALELPTNVNELNKIGEAAGQLGIQTENILGFTETMAALGETTNLSAEAASTSLARLANITGLQQDEFDNLGSAIVGLGNNFATTESEIVDFGLRIAGAGELAGLSEGEILGIGTAMSSIGVQAEAGGTAVQKVLNEINQSVATGDEELRVFAEVAGMTAEQFSAAFREDAAGAFESFVTGLGTQGDKSFTVMEDLGLESERVIRAFLGLANSGDLLSRAMEEGTEAFEDNSALAAEVALRYGTTASQIKILWNHLTELRIVLGNQLLPALLSLVDIAKPVLLFVISAVEWWSKWPGPLKVASLAVLALVAAVGPALLIGGTILTSWATLTLAFPVLGAALLAAGLKAKAFWVALTGPIGWAIAGLAAVAGAVYHFREELGLVKRSIEDMGVEAARQRIEDLEDQMNRASGDAVLNIRRAIKDAREELEQFESAAVEADAALESMKSSLPSFSVTLKDAESQLAQAKSGLNQMATAGMVVNAEMEDWVDGLESHVAALRETKKSTDAVSESLAALVAKWTGAKFNIGEFNAAFSLLTEEQRANKVIMSEVLAEYETARTKLGSFNAELERMSQAERRATDEADRLVDVGDLLGDYFRQADKDAHALAKELAQLEEEAIAAAAAFDRKRESLLGLPTPETTADFERLRAVWASIEEPDAETTTRYAEALRHAADNGIDLSDAELAILAATEQADAAIGSMDATLASLAGGLGGATGQAINLWTSMQQFNDSLEDGETKIGKARMGAALLSGVMQDLANEVGGVAGAVLQAGANIASAFATGGPLAGAIAGIAAGVKGLFSLFGGGKRRMEEARAAAEAARVRMAEVVAERTEAEIALTATIVSLETERHALVMEGIDAEIEATEQAKSAALSSLNEQIAAVQALTVEKLNAVRIQLAAAQGNVIDVSATKGIAKRLNVDISDATVFGAQAASERITALAEDIAALQKAGVEVSAGISQEFDAEMRAAVSAVNRFGVTIPESLRTIVATFPGIETEALAFGDGLTDAARRVKELEEERDQIQTDANARLQELAIERQDIEALFDEELSALATVRMDTEAGFVHGLEDIAVRRAQVEEDLAAAVELAASNLRAAAPQEVSALADFQRDDELRDSPFAHYSDQNDEFDGFARGTRGKFIDFGSSSTVKLHGKERVMTEDEGRREASSNAASLKGVEDRLDRLDTNLQRAIKRISTDVTNVVMTKSL